LNQQIIFSRWFAICRKEQLISGNISIGKTPLSQQSVFFFFGEYKSGHCSKVITHIPMPEVLDRLRASLFINWDKLEHGWIPSNEIGTHLGFIFHG
jgi:hypothetical protein